MPPIGPKRGEPPRIPSAPTGALARPGAPAEARPLAIPPDASTGRAALAKLLDGKKERGPAAPEVLVGDEGLGPERLAEEPPLFVAEHLMVLLSRKRARLERRQVLEEIGELVLGLPDPHFARRVLYAMAEVGRIVDIYPLEVLAYVLGRAPGYLPGVEVGPFVLNKAELEAAPYAIEEEIRIRVPLALKLRAFALDGGGSPGYCLQPGAPGEYVLELADGGRFPLLLRGELKRRHLVDRVVVTVRPDPEPR